MENTTIQQMQHHLYLTWLPANQAYAFTLGDSIVSMCGQHLFANRIDAIDAANHCGLAVAIDGKVTPIKKEA